MEEELKFNYLNKDQEWDDEWPMLSLLNVGLNSGCRMWRINLYNMSVS